MSKAINDLMKDSLIAQGYSGALPDMLLDWLQDNGATANDLPTAWVQACIANGATAVDRNTAWYQTLESLGHTGSISDREHQFWEAGGALALLLDAPLQTSLTPRVAKGSGTPTFTRASARTIVDFEGKVRTCLDGEAGFMGARRVYNMEVGTDITAWLETATSGTTITHGVPDPFGGNLASRIEMTSTTGAAGWYSTQVISAVGTIIYSVWARCTSHPTANIFLGQLLSATNIPITSEWKRYSATRTDGGLMVFSSDINQLGYTIEFAYPQLEIHESGIPGEDVTVGELSAPYHGAGVDGVKYFSYKNGNTVVGNVVNSGTGAAIGASDYYADADGPFGYVSENAATNLALHNRNFADAVWSASNITPLQDATGADGVASAASTLTANANNGTILQTVTSASAERTVSCYVKRKTGTGTVEITVDGGTTWDTITSDINSSTYTWVQYTQAAVTNPQIGFRLGTSGDEIEVDYFQLENNPFATTPIETAASTDDRAVDALTYPDTDNFAAAAGTAKIEALSWSNDPSVDSDFILARDIFAILIYAFNADGVVTATAQLSVSAQATGDSLTDGYVHSLATAWGDDLTVYYDGVAGTPNAAYAGAYGSGAIALGNVNVGGVSNWNGTLRGLKIYDQEGFGL